MPSKVPAASLAVLAVSCVVAVQAAGAAPCAVTTPIGVGNDEAYDLAIQPDGAIVVVGYSFNGSNDDFAVVRYLPDFTLDTTFDSDGMAVTPVGSSDDRAQAVAVQPDGKIVVVGYSTSGGGDRDITVVRYDANGSLDLTFDGDGMTTIAVGAGNDELSDVALQPDGKIVVIGRTWGGADYNLFVARFTTGGLLDPTFTGGYTSFSLGLWDQVATAVALQSDGKIVVVGKDSALADDDILVVRYDTGGVIDSTFGGGLGYVTYLAGTFDTAEDVAIQPDGKIVVVGTSDLSGDRDVFVSRLDASGGLDSTFNGSGFLSTDLGSLNDFGKAVAIQPDGKIVVAGYSDASGSYDMTALRYDTNGALDASFDSDGVASVGLVSSGTTARAVQVEPSGHIVMAGGVLNGFFYDFALARLNPDGSSPCGQIVLHPTNAGTVNNFSTLTGCTASWDCVNDQLSNAAIGPPLPTDGLTSSLHDNNGGTGREMFRLVNGAIPAGAFVVQIEIAARMGKGSGSAQAFQLSYQRVGTDPVPVDGPVMTVAQPCCLDTPSWIVTGIAWTSSELDDLEIGLHHTAGGAIEISQIYVQVTYLETAPRVNYRSIGTAPDYATGSVQAMNGSPIVTGAGTMWKTANRGQGDRIQIDGVDYTVLSVDSEAILTLTEPFTGATGSFKPYVLSRQYAGPGGWESCIRGGVCSYFPVVSASLVADNRREVGILYDDGSTYTNPLLIAGATTDATHDIVLTVNPSDRHGGRAGTGAAIDLSGVGGPGVQIEDDHVTIEWLEIRNTSTDGIGVSLLGPANRIVLRNNLLHDLPGKGIQNGDPAALLEIYNNVVYDVTEGIDLGGPSSALVLNNTLFQGSGSGVLSAGAGAVTLRNNLVHSFPGPDYSVGTLDPSSSNNLSSDGSAAPHSPGGGAIANVPLAGVAFVSTLAGSEDLHIGSGSLARDMGAVLALFNNDVDGATRNSPWDIGADEVGAPAPFTIHYRSIGTNGGDLATGIASISAGSTTVTFLSALPSNIGQGDELVLDPGGGNEETFYILSRNSGTDVTVESPAALAHAGEAFRLRRAFVTLANWEAARDGDLVAENRREVGVIYNDGPFAAGVDFDGSTTDASRYMELTVAPGSRHLGIAGTGALVDGGNTVAGEIAIHDDYTAVAGLEVTRVREVGAAGVRVSATGVRLDQLLVHHNIKGVRLSGFGGHSFILRNSIAYANDDDGIEGDEITDVAVVENCTLYGNGAKGIDEATGAPFTVRNTSSLSNGTGDYDIPSGTQSHNISSDGTASGPGALTFVVPAGEFVSTTPGAEDLHLKAGAVAAEKALDLSGSFTVDIDGLPRPTGASWDIGADELGTAAGSPSISSAGNQFFIVGSAPTIGVTVSVYEDSLVASITAVNDVRIRIPAGFPMRFDPTQTTVLLGGPAASKLKSQVKAYEDGNRTVVLDAVADFAPGDRFTVDNLRFWSFTAPASPASLELEVGNDGIASAVDDKTISILPDGFVNLSSDDHQVFTQLQPPVLALPFTVTDGSAPSITVGNGIKIRIPAGFNMTWDTSVTVVSVSGTGAANVDPGNVVYQDFDRTLYIPVVANFSSGQYVTVSGPKFQGFSAPSPASNLSVDVGASSDTDDKTIVIEAASDVRYFTATSTSRQVKVEWLTPKSGACDFVLILARDDATPPTGPFDPMARVLDNRTCTLDTRDSVVDDTPPLTNGNLYAYAAFVDYGGGYTNGKFVRARPMDTLLEPVQWAYSTAATAMAAPGLRFSGGASFVYAVSNDSILHAMNGGAGGGDWPSGWTPYALGGPAQARPPVVFWAIGAAPNGAAFLGSQDGNVYAVDASSGAEVWKSPIATMVQAAPAGHFTFVDPTASNVIITGTRNAGAPNTVEALDVPTGASKWTFDNTPPQFGDGKDIGIVNGSASLDYLGKRLFFASRVGTGANGSTDTLWCLDISGPTPQLLWAKSLGDIDGSPIFYNNVVFVGTVSGVLYAVDPVGGSVSWSLPLGDGPIKGFVFPQFGTNNVLLSTTGTVWSVEDKGSGYNINWKVTSTDVPSPSTPVYVPGTGKVLVGSSDGHLYQMDAGAPLPATRAVLGDGTAAVGVPTVDILKMMIYVGTDEGVVYGLTFPLP